jgi:hypothetical protein
MLLSIASILMVATGVIHSVAGEFFILRHAWKMEWPAFFGSTYQSKAIVRITWHLATIFAFAFAAIIAHTTDRFIIQTIAAMCAASSLLVCIGTKARHPGWLAFGAMAILSILA